MTTSHQSIMAIGNLYNNIADHLQPARKLYSDDMTEYMESVGLTFFSPWLNAEPQYWFVGIALPDTPVAEKAWIRWIATVEQSHNRLRELVGPDLKLELRAVLNVW